MTENLFPNIAKQPLKGGGKRLVPVRRLLLWWEGVKGEREQSQFCC